MEILVAPSGFKESLDAQNVAEAITRGIRRVLPATYIRTLPLVDGGEGFTQELVKTTCGSLHNIKITGPTGAPTDSFFGFLGRQEVKTAVIEVAAAAGLKLVPVSEREPQKTTTYGVGELIKAALDAGAQRILLGCGDSGTNDGGAGAAAALGVKLLDCDGQLIGLGGEQLSHLNSIDLSCRDSRLANVKIDIACNWHNVLCGADGVARIFGPQKGASPETVTQLEASLENFAAVIQKTTSLDVRTLPGGGASGGLGAGALALLGAKLHPRFDIVTRYLNLDSALKGCDLVFTAEGAIDFQTPRGKIPAEVARRAKLLGLPVVAIVGTVGDQANDNYEYGIDAFFSLINRPMDLKTAIEKDKELLASCAENVMRGILVGKSLSNH